MCTLKKKGKNLKCMVDRIGFDGEKKNELMWKKNSPPWKKSHNATDSFKTKKRKKKNNDNHFPRSDTDIKITIQLIREFMTTKNVINYINLYMYNNIDVNKSFPLKRFLITQFFEANSFDSNDIFFSCQLESMIIAIKQHLVS